ncbi:hypothetical protein PhaeoP23_03957 (plasmid) [Phaeobacter piscinae]|uniref:DUF192 domain-containing protein n=2 Tax=Roseobacteraceae TaxID=2854170 RepID=A0ABN5DL52_9RHOB|nr:hypothetical protein PhaeoP36_04035 [Phaeobacter piscinae]AUQ88631.1 hypothetical protein PhaeoP42_04036 [Phaeobacter piscinae]AUQ92630.1 hypothetical protein PhaeoP24_04072 [Phaeobacter inhibens]AUR26436.1 hypothetical protein PhaeoP23_03957 [Phaeobacter piscinae]
MVSVLAVAGFFALQKHAERREVCQTAIVSIEAADGFHDFAASVAATSKQRAQGMQGKSSFEPYEAMLFVYQKPRTVQFWMKNTPLELDILFVGAGGRLQNIHENAKPFSSVPILSGENVVAVVEIPAGSVSEIGIRPNGQVHFELSACP